MKQQRFYDVDDVAVELACHGDRSIALNPAELRQAYEALDRRGHTLTQIADTLGVSTRAVSRWRAGPVYFKSRPARPVALRQEVAGAVRS